MLTDRYGRQVLTTEFEAARDTYVRAMDKVTSRPVSAYSQAQLDLVEFTLLTAYWRAADFENAQSLLRNRRPGPSSVPVAGVEAISLH